MRGLVGTALICSGLLSVSGAALAADIPMKAPIAAPVMAPAFSWSGCYVGGYAGGAWGRNVNVAEGTALPGGTFPAGTAYNAPNSAPYSYQLGSSFIGGGTAGCNYQMSSFVVGLEGELGYLRLRGSAIDPNSVPLFGSDTTDSTRVGDWYGLVTARAGVTWDRALLYLKGGAAFIRSNSLVVDTCSTGPCGSALISASGNSSNNVTWAAGGGLEYALSQNWSVKGEYMYIALRQSYATCGAGGGTAAGSTFCWTQTLDGVHTAKFGVNYRF
jgi:outer membrane immunogenic protein